MTERVSRRHVERIGMRKLRLKSPAESKMMAPVSVVEA
jgi:hypothetical protein